MIKNGFLAREASNSPPRCVLNPTSLGPAFPRWRWMQFNQAHLSRTLAATKQKLRRPSFKQTHVCSAVPIIDLSSDTYINKSRPISLAVFSLAPNYPSFSFEGADRGLRFERTLSLFLLSTSIDCSTNTKKHKRTRPLRISIFILFQLAYISS